MDLTDKLLHVACRDCKALLMLHVRKHHAEQLQGVRTLGGAQPPQPAGPRWMCWLSWWDFARNMVTRRTYDHVLQLWLWI